MPSAGPRSFANTCSPPPQIPGRPSAPCVRPSGVPSTSWLPLRRSLTSCRRTAPSTTSRTTLIASSCARPLARGVPAPWPRERSPARCQWPSARGTVAAPQPCGDPHAPQLGGRGRSRRTCDRPTASGPPSGGPRRVRGRGHPSWEASAPRGGAGHAADTPSRRTWRGIEGRSNPVEPDSIVPRCVRGRRRHAARRVPAKRRVGSGPLTGARRKRGRPVPSAAPLAARPDVVVRRHAIEGRLNRGMRGSVVPRRSGPGRANGAGAKRSTTTTSRPVRGGSYDIKPAASYSPGPLRAKYHRR
jgi:hypothetical protein